MAWTTQSRKRTKSMTNLIDTSRTNKWDKSQQNKSGFPQLRGASLSPDDYDNDLMENCYSNLNSSLTPQKKISKLKGRHYSSTTMLQTNSIINTAKCNMEETIIETIEEDNMTQMSDLRQ